MRKRNVQLKLRKNKSGDIGMICLSYLRALKATGVICKADDFDPEVGILATDPKAKIKNARLIHLKAQVELAIGERLLDEAEFTSICDSVINPEKAEAKKAASELFLAIFDERAAMANKPKTKLTFDHTRKLVAEFDEKVKIDDVTPKWLNSFEAWLKGKGCKTNGIGIHMRNLRVICNYAITEGRTTNYPFRQYKIKKEATAKRSLTVEQLRELRDFPCDKIHERYRDVFMLMFYFRGVNAVDLFNATHDNIRNGRFEYRRSKTGHFFSIKIEPEAQAILDKYSGGEHLLSVIDNCKWDTFMQHMDKELKKIGPATIGKHGKKDITPLFPGLTSYWSRHTWATMAAEIDIPKDTIGKALGHEWACVTDTYIKFNEKKVDEASRRVIDYLNGSHKTEAQWQQELLLQQEESRRKQDELLEANRRLQEQLMKLLEKIA